MTASRAAFAITFACVFSVLYVICVEYNLALVTYHPAIKEFEFLTTPPKTGPAMWWYGWLLTSAVGAAIAGGLAALLPASVTQHLWPGLAWLVPLAVLAVFCYLLRGFFLR